MFSIEYEKFTVKNATSVDVALCSMFTWLLLRAEITSFFFWVFGWRRPTYAISLLASTTYKLYFLFPPFPFNSPVTGFLLTSFVS